MPTQELSGTTALVTGASRGFGRAIAVALWSRGAHVAGVARDPGRLEELRAQLGDTFTPVTADAADPVVAGHLLDQHLPRTLVLNAGAAPLPRPIHQQTWRTFSRNWEVDVQHVFNWLGIRFTSVLPQLTPETGLGAAGVAAYAARQGVGIPAFLDRLGPALTPEQVGTAIVDIITGSADDRDAYLLTATGLSPVP
jgi:NADP-dependent 3-hydroxy acid dehydrogenase YdfG